MQARCQQTIDRMTELEGYGLFTNANVRVRFFPAEENHGIVFERVDLPGCPQIPAHIRFLAAEDRRTKLVKGSASVEMTEHLLAALAGLQIDNCLIQIDAPELPGCDGSALPYVESLLEARIVPQRSLRKCVRIEQQMLVEDQQAVLTLNEAAEGLRISYELNYGAESPIPSQMADFTITPETFLDKIAPARTFILEREITALRQKGYGQHVTYQDIVVYGEQGPVENVLRAHNECARHKLLDCLGDLLLCGCDVQGHLRAFRSGHRHNHLLARQVYELSLQGAESVGQKRAA